MARINLTLDRNTYTLLDEHARKLHKPRARVVKEILLEGLAQREAMERRKRLARDYAAGRDDTREVLEAWEVGQLEMLEDEGI